MVRFITLLFFTIYLSKIYYDAKQIGSKLMIFFFSSNIGTRMRVTEAARETKTTERSSMAAAYSIYLFRLIFSFCLVTKLKYWY